MAKSLRDHSITTTKDERCTYIPIQVGGETVGTTHPVLIDICWKLQEENEEEEGEEGEEEGEEGEAGKEEASLHKDSRSGMLVFLKHAVELVVARCLHEKNRHRKSDPRQKKIQGSSSSNNNSSGGHRQVVSQWKSLVHRLMMTNKKTNHVHALTGWLRGLHSTSQVERERMMMTAATKIADDRMMDYELENMELLEVIDGHRGWLENVMTYGRAMCLHNCTSLVDIIIRTKHMLQAWIGYNAIVHVFLLEENTRNTRNTKHHDEEDGGDSPPPPSSSSSSVFSETSRIAKLKQKRKTNKNSKNTKHKRNKHVKPRTTASVSGVLWSIDEMSGETFTMSKTRQGFQQGKNKGWLCLCVGGL